MLVFVAAFGACRAMGIMWHNTNIHHAGLDLTRRSVPLCQNVSDHDMHNFSLDAGKQTLNEVKSIDYNEYKKKGTGATELELCLNVFHEEDFRWDNRNFNVGLDMIEKFVDTFFHYQVNASAATNSIESEVPPCSDWQKKGEENGFYMYNLICKGEDGITKPHHYYKEYVRIDFNTN